MTSNKDSVTSLSICDVCYKNVEYYSIGICEHSVCYECSTRMRALCQQNECPICRQDLPKVVFTKVIKPFRHLKKSDDLFDSRYNIYFESPEIQEKFTRLLSNVCKVCRDYQVFSSFTSLKEHMKQKHYLFYCDLCVENLKIFSFERKCYTKSELSIHETKGDPDNRSHRGHPLCEFCKRRYMDTDELYRHLRRDHLFCHFCDADGLHHYYDSYEVLKDHFRQDHYLCEEAGCSEEQFTSVFRTDIDLKAHIFSVHKKQLGKAAAKQARTLELEFTLAPRGDRNRRLPGPYRVRHNESDNHSNFSRYNQEQTPQEVQEEATFVRQPLVDVQSTEEFPTLGNTTPSASINPPLKSRGNLTIRSTLRPQTYDQNFPALVNDSANNTVPSQGAMSKTLNFSLSSMNKQQPTRTTGHQNPPPNVSIHLNHRPNSTSNTRLSGPNIRIQPGCSKRDSDFPVLGRSDTSSSSNDNVLQWTRISCVKPNSRSRKIASPPLLPTTQPPSGEDFPILSKSDKTKKTASVSVSSNSPTWVQVQSTTSNGSAQVTDATIGKTKKKKKQTVHINNLSNNETNSILAPKNFTEKKSSSTDLMHKETKVNNNLTANKKTKNESPVQASPVEISNPVKLNSVQRKRSELKIDSLNTNNNNANYESMKQTDFPALNETAQTSRHPPGFTKPPPPGFAPPSTPPPGFLSRASDLTFTSSSGQKYTILPDGQENKNFSIGCYTPPNNFQSRNQNLVAQLNGCFDNSEESDELRAFRFLSGLFKDGQCSAEEYYERCRAAIGNQAFQAVFPELMALLPDIKKQRELFSIYKNEMLLNGVKIDNLESCASCGQILKSDDSQEHRNMHALENDFPTLIVSGLQNLQKHSTRPSN